LTSFSNQSHLDTTKSFNHIIKQKTLGISIVLYRVGKADKIEELSNLEMQFKPLFVKGAAIAALPAINRCRMQFSCW
jgi:hypothetical protein